MKTLLNATTLLVLIVGGLNWLLVGVAKYDLVASAFGGADTVPARTVYILVGFAALYQLLPLGRILGRRR
jgi:uncharacterized membrane protein YuzA (DUF378 family)